jgi:hypothetical protein
MNKNDYSGVKEKEPKKISFFGSFSLPVSSASESSAETAQPKVF